MNKKTRQFFIGFCIVQLLIILWIGINISIEHERCVVVQEHEYPFPPGCEFYLVKTHECIPYPR